MDTIVCALAAVEDHPALTQALGIIFAAIIALIAARKAYQGVLEQIRANAQVEIRAKLHEQRAMYCAFASDLDALRKSLNGFYEALIVNDNANDLGICKSVILASRNVVWESCAHNIGVLDPNHAANIIETY